MRLTPKRLFYVDWVLSKIMLGLLRIRMGSILLKPCLKLLLNILCWMVNKSMKGNNLCTMIGSFLELTRFSCLRTFWTQNKGLTKSTKTKKKLDMNLPSMKDNRNLKIKVFSFTPITTPQTEKDLQVKFPSFKKKNWSVNCSKSNKNFRECSKKMRKEHAKNKPNTNKNSSNSKNKKNSNKPKNKLSNRNSMKRKNKPTNWSPSNWKYKNFRKNLPNLSKRKSKDKSPDKACF